MRHLIRLTDWTRDDIRAVYELAAAYETGHGPRTDGVAVLFFPDSSLRTRVTFERGAALLGLQPMLFPPETLDKPEDPRDVVGYLANWADLLVVRHPDITVLEGLCTDHLPVINAMSSVNHPCEVLSDVYALSRPTSGETVDPRSLRLLFVGADGNIARAWAEIAVVLDLDLVQCCPADLAVPGLRTTDDLTTAIRTADVVLTDGPGPHAAALAPYRITEELLALAPPGVRLAPCPPFQRDREVSAGAIASPIFVGYAFKRALLPVQQGVMAYCCGLR